ncbi:MAG: hypothetical protein M3O91_06865 [Chloroflexota bacterium]|nr:hypothetical protein [Chloroflexota bacterium]
MTRRDAMLVLGTLVLAVVVAGLLLVGSMAAARPGERPRFYFGRDQLPAGRSLVETEQRVPAAFRSIVPLQRGVSDTARDAAGFVLVLLGVTGALVLARGPVVAGYRASLGGWRAQLRVLATGLAVLALIASAAFLSFVFVLGGVAGSGGLRAAGLRPQPLLETGLIAITLGIVILAAVALVGFAAAAWRLGDLLTGLPPVARWGSQLPAPLSAIVGATVFYVAAQLPAVGAAVALLVLAYALGVVVTARLGGAAESLAIPAPS